MNKRKHSLSTGLSLAAVVVAGVCLATSLAQAGIFIDGFMGSGIQRNIMIGGILGALLGSQVLGRLVGSAIKAKAPSWAVLVGVISIVIIEALSIVVSTISFDGNLLASSRQTNLDSPEYLQTQANIKVYRDQIDTLQNQINDLPSDWITKRNLASEKILALQEKVMQQQDRANAVNVATSDQAFDRLADTTGFKQQDISLIMGLLLSLVPMAINLLCGSLAWSAKPEKEKTPAKKSRPRLRAVPA